MARTGWTRPFATALIPILIPILGPILGLILGLTLGAQAARASGPSEPAPHYIDQFGGEVADLQRLWDGRIGVVMARAPRPELYIKWRLLHGLAVGPAAGAALSKPCCDTPGSANVYQAGPDWQTTRKLVSGAPAIRGWMDLERKQDDGVSTPNCFSDALDLAADTLKDRVRAHGPGDPGVRAWLATQDAVFAACSSDQAQLPPALAGAPAWLRADRAYQEAAFALYMGRNAEAARRFGAIGKDPTSPWRGSALYLTARALWRDALAHPGPATEAAAGQALTRLAASPSGSFGQGQAQPLREALAVRLHPDTARAALEAVLARPVPGTDIAVRFRDLSDLADDAAARGERSAEVMDWIATLKGVSPRAPQPPAPPAPAPTSAGTDPEAQAQAEVLAQAARDAKQAEADRREALAHASDRWRAGHDPAWLVAALTLADPGDAGSAALIADAKGIGEAYPGWLTLQHHLIRLAATTTPSAVLRGRLDGLLARQDLSTSDRNLLLGERAQLSADLEDFLGHVLRRRICVEQGGEGKCPRADWSGSWQSGGVFDGEGASGTVGLGDESLAILDRMPLDLRLQAGTDPRLPERLRLDLALTSFARAVDLQEPAALDALTRQLEALLPALAPDFAAIRSAAPGADKRFAEFYVLAKIPGVKTDLIDYVRPEGKVDDYQGYWADWMVMAPRAPLTGSAPPRTYLYQETGQGANPATPEARLDLTCLGECGLGAEPLRLPDFVARAQPRALAERGYFLRVTPTYTGSGMINPPRKDPPGAVSAWEEMLAYVAAHPKDPRAPEALYWLVHVGHFGGSHNHSGRRAFKLLKARYPTSVWSGRVKYYYD